MKDKETTMLDLLGKSNIATAIYTSAALDIGFINRGMRAVFGHPLDTGKLQFSDLLPEGSQPALASLLSEAWNSGKHFQLRAYPIKIRDEGAMQWKYVDWSVQPILDTAGVTEAMIHTVTETSNPMQARRGEQVGETSSEAKLERWRHSLSHDLRNPLSVAKLGMQIMGSRTQMTPEEHTKWVSMVIEASKNVEKLITDTLELSRSPKHDQAYTNYKLDIVPLIHNIVENNGVLTGSGNDPIEIKTLLPIRGDIEVLSQVFTLAIKYAMQALADKSKSMLTMNSTVAEKRVIYTISADNLDLDEFYVGHSALVQLMQEVGGRVDFDSQNKCIQLNFPIF